MFGIDDILGGLFGIGGAVADVFERDRVQGILSSLPGYKPADPAAEQTQAIAQNSAQLQAAGDLMAGAASRDQDTLESVLERAIPGYKGLQTQASKLLQEWLAGRVPSDVTRSVRQSAAEKAGAKGLFGGTAARALEARDLGTTTLGLQSGAMGQLMNWLTTSKNVGAVSPVSVTSMFVTPGQRISTALTNNQLMYESLMNRALGKAHPGTLAAASDAMSGVGGMLSGGILSDIFSKPKTPYNASLTGALGPSVQAGSISPWGA